MKAPSLFSETLVSVWGEKSRFNDTQLPTRSDDVAFDLQSNQSEQ